MLHRSIRRLVSSAFFIPVVLFAESIHIAGKLTDDLGKPIPLATVTLKKYALSATTDENGLYRINGETTPITTVTKSIQSIAPKMIGSQISFAIPESRSVKLDLYSLAGRKIGTVVHDNLSAGTYSINPFSSQNVGTGVYLVRYSDGVSTATLKAVSGGSNPVNAASVVTPQSGISSRAVREEPTMDTLLVKSKEGSEITAVPLKSLVDSLPTMFVVQRNIGGSFSAVANRGVGKITALLTEDGVAEPKTMKLGFNKANNSYSGFVYSLYSADTKNYSVQVNVFASDSLVSGKSVAVDYTNDLGNVEVPAFDPNNVLPTVMLEWAGFGTRGDTLYYPLSATLSGVEPTAVAGKILIEWALNDSILKLDTIPFSKTALVKDTVTFVPTGTNAWIGTDQLRIRATPILLEPFVTKGIFQQTDALVSTLPIPQATKLAITLEGDSLRGTYQFGCYDLVVKEGVSLFQWYKNGVLLASGKSAIAVPQNVLKTDTITFAVTPVAANAIRAVGESVFTSKTNLGRDISLEEFLTNKSTYYSDYRYPFADTLGARGGVGNGGFRDSWGSETQLQVAIPKANFVVNGATLNFSDDSAQFYWMGLAAVQELCGYDLQLFASMGAKESFSGLNTKRLGTGGPYQLEYPTLVDRAMNYVDLYPKYSDKLSKALDYTTAGINGQEFQNYYEGTGSLSKPTAVNSAIIMTQVTTITDKVLEASKQIYWHKTLESPKDSYLGASVLLAMHNLGMWGQMGAVASKMSVTTWETTANDPNGRDLFAVGNGNYRNEILSVATQLESASKQSLTDKSVAIMDFAITKQELNDLFFGENGTVAVQGSGGILQHWHLDSSDPVRQTIADQLNLCFDQMKGRAPSIVGKDAISFRYDLLFILRSVKEYLPFNPPVPTKGDAAMLIGQYSK